MRNVLSPARYGREERIRALSPLNPGRVPNGWQTESIGALSRKVTNGFVGTSLPHQVEGEGITYLQGFNIRPCKIDLSKRTYVTSEFHRANKKSQLKEGDILVVQSGHIGTAARVPANFGEANCHALIIVDVDRTKLDPDYVVEHLNSAIGQARMRGLHVGSSMLHINTSELAEYILPFPELSVQRKIAAILRTWDLALEKLSTLRKAKERRFVGLRQHLFDSRGGYTDRWQYKPLSAITIRVRRKNDGGDHPVMTISAKSGFLMQSDKFARDMAGNSAERYTLLHQGEFAYNKGNSLTAPYGCIYELDRPTAVVPFVYYSFALNAGLDRMFYKHLFSGGILNHQLSRIINSGVRNDGLLNLDVEDFFACKVPVPPLEEQREIGHILTTAKSELDLLDREIAALTRQKRGLMQKLLTGEWAVNVEGVAA